MRRFGLIGSLFLGVVLSAVVAPAADAQPKPPSGEQAAGDDLTAESAQKLIDAGNRALRESNETPSRAVDAALAFSKALPYYQQAGDTDRICDLEAAIFWCKKRMNIDDIKRFLAAKGGSATDEDLLVTAEIVVNKKVLAEEVQAYFDRAEKFAKENPTSYALITVRFFEVAERFPGTEIGRKAHVLSLAAQKKDMELLAAERVALQITLFSQPESPRDEAKLAAMPASEEIKSATAELKKTYKSEFAMRRPGQRRSFATRLAKEAEASGTPVAQRAAMFDLALDSALDLNDYHLVLAFAEKQSLSFSGPGVRERQRQVMAEERTNPTGAAIAKLLDTPDDQPANTVAGRHFCFELNKWDLGIPMLARGEPSDLQMVAGMELIKPEGWMQQVELADRWYVLGKKTYGEVKGQMMARSFHWYNQAKPNVSGITKERILQRLEEVGDLLPESHVDYANLTVKQWTRLPGKVVEILATTQRNDLGLVLKPGTKVRIVPHPAATWSFFYYDYTWPKNLKNVFDTDATGHSDKGTQARSLRGHPDFCIGQVMMAIDTGEAKPAGVLSGSGRVFIGPWLPGTGTGKGKMPVKVMIVEEE